MDAQFPGNLNQAACYGSRFGIGLQLPYKHALQLHCVDGKVQDTADRSASGAEVVEHQLHTHVGEFLHGDVYIQIYIGQGAVIYLQGQLAFGYPVGLKDLCDLLQEIFLNQKHRRNRDTDGVKYPSGIHQLAYAFSGMVQGVVSNGPNLTGILCYGHKLSGAHQSDALNEDSHVGISPCKTAFLQVIGGTVADFQLILFQGCLKVHGNSLAADELGMHAAVIYSHLVRSPVGGSRHSQVQALKQLIRVGCMTGIGAEAYLCGTQTVHAAYFPNISEAFQNLISQVTSLPF